MAKKIVLDLKGDSLATWRGALNRATKHYSKLSSESIRAMSTDAPLVTETLDVLSEISEQLRSKR